MSSNPPLGIAFSVGSTILTNVGILLQKQSADLERSKILCYRWRFWMGMLLNLGSEAGLTTLAMMYAPLSTLAPLAGLGVVFNALLSRSGLISGRKETMGVHEWSATFMIVVGVSLVAVAGPSESAEEAETTAEMIAYLPAAFMQPIFLGYTVTATTIVFSWLFVTEQKCCPAFRRRFRDKPSVSVFESSLEETRLNSRSRLNPRSLISSSLALTNHAALLSGVS